MKLWMLNQVVDTEEGKKSCNLIVRALNPIEARYVAWRYMSHSPPSSSGSKDWWDDFRKAGTITELSCSGIAGVRLELYGSQSDNTL